MLPAELLAENPLFDTMATEDIEALSQKLIEHKAASGEIIFSKGDTGASMYVIRSGSVEIFLPPEKDSPRVVLRELRSGQYFGELSLFDGKPRSASAEATSKTELFELRRDDFADHLSRSKPATIAILSELAERLRETNNLLSQRAAKHVIKEIEENLTLGQRMADKVASMNGSWGFIIMLLTATISWAILNAFMPKPFDQYPYQFFNFALAVLVSLQGPLIVMSQNRQTMKDRAQAETDYRVNLKNEIGIETLIQEMGAFRAETRNRLAALERTDRGDRSHAEIPAGESALRPPV